jgi:hypothetical protein
MDAITNAINQVRTTLPQGAPDLPAPPKLPVETNPDVLKQKIKADLLDKKIEIDRKKLAAKEKAIKTAKEKLKSLPFPSLKAVQDKIIALLEKQLADDRAKLAKSNMDKAKEVHTYPIKKLKSQATAAREAANIPTLSDAPKLPGAPNIPKPPKLPSAPSVPKLPLR